MVCIHFILALLLCGPIWANDRIRAVRVKRDEIVTIKTALNVATIVQVPDAPTSLVVGDSSAFKVEYLDQAITIKPLHSSAKTNLYIYTEYRRFDVSLVTVGEQSADYVVYLKQFQAPIKPSQAIQWRSFDKKFLFGKLTFRIKRLGRFGNTGLLEFEVSSSSIAKIDPGIFWLTLRGATFEIEKLVLSSIDVGPKHTSSGSISFKIDKLKTNDQLAFEVRQNGKSKLLLPKNGDWK